MVWVSATVHHLDLGEYFPDFPCGDCYIPVRLLAVALQERLVQVIGIQKVTSKLSIEIIYITLLKASILFQNKKYFTAKDQASGKATDVEKGEARVSNGSSHFQFHNIDLQRASSKGSVLSSAGKVLIKRDDIYSDFYTKKNLSESRFFSPGNSLLLNC